MADRNPKTVAKKVKGKYRQQIRRLWRLYILFITLTILFFVVLSLNFLGRLPSLKELENPHYFEATEIYSSDGIILGNFFFENRVNIIYENLSPHLVNALVSTEDERFYDHSGIDVWGLARAVAFLGQRGGASTITQQLAKMLFHRRSGNFFLATFQKLKEWIIAVRIEKNFTKEEIIALYLNKFDFNNNAVGVKMAANVYFNKKPGELHIEEAATLIGMLQNPVLFNPVRNTDTTVYRRNIVLGQMCKNNFISVQARDSLRALPLVLDFKRPVSKESSASYFREILRLKMQNILSEKDILGRYKYLNDEGEPYDLYRDGLKIYTTIDSRMQKYAEEAVDEYIGGQLQGIFNKDIKKRSNPPFSNAINGKQREKIISRLMENSDRYRVLTGKLCANCGRSGTEKKSEGGKEYYVCPHDDCGHKMPVIPLAEIPSVFSKPVEMKVFSWKGEIDTVMSPYDSVIFYMKFLQAGLLSVDPSTGYVKAWVGGINRKYFGLDHVVQSKRQVGSTVKPFLYAMALDEGFSPCDSIPNIPYVVSNGHWGQVKDWSPGYGPEFEGYIDMRFALANSMNNFAAYLIDQVGPVAFSKYLNNMGIRSEIDPVPSLCLGTADFSLYELVGAYTVFPNLGVHTEPMFILRIEDRNGRELIRFTPDRQRVMNETTAYTVLFMMKGVADGVYNRYYGKKSSTGMQRIRNIYKLTIPCAGKTGTTQNNSDGWFMGVTPELVTGVWVGAENPGVRFSSTNLGQGAATALPVWAIYMKKLLNDPLIGLSDKDFEKPEGFDESIFNCDSIRAQETLIF